MIKNYKSIKPSQGKKENFTSEVNKSEQHSKIDKLDISLLSRNITNLFEQIKSVTNEVQFKNILHENK